MTDENGQGHTVHIGGNVSGQVAVGNHNVLHAQRIQAPVSAAELTELLSALRAEIAELLAGTDAPLDGQADTKLDELAEALTGDEVDLATVEHVQGWFRRKLPRCAAAVNRVVLGPVVARLVAEGGDQLAAEFTRRIGG
jgi:hypothetical protein